MLFSGKEVKAGNDKSGDVLVTLELSDGGGVNFELVSKVARKYGPAIKATAEKVLAAHNIKNANILVEDFGALDFVISARIETALVRAMGRGAE